MRCSPAIIPAFCAFLFAVPAAGADRTLGDLGQVGTVHFPTTCDPSVQADFERGLALLHSFFYDEARRVFTDVARRDPECAMAHWGVAMTYYHPIWTAPDSTELAAGEAAVARAVAASKQDARERAYVHAMEAFYRGLETPLENPEEAGMSCHAPSMADPRGRAACWSREMERVTAAYPEDVDAAAFYALSLLGTAKPGDPTLLNPRRSAEILETWSAEHGNHPGIIHYLIHSYDYPQLAERGLPAARSYAAVAPWVPHALHMPSHIFTRMGMWPETIESNLASAEAARSYAAAYFPGAATHEELHALDYLVYAYLQTGQDGKAHDALLHVNAVEKTHPEIEFAAAYALGAVPARYALERRQWKEAAALSAPSRAMWKVYPFGEGHLAFARAVGAARTGDTQAARASAGRLTELAAAARKSPRLQYFADQMELQREAALGLISLAESDRAAALERLRLAADREDSLGKHPVSPGALLPIRELYAEALLETGEPALALAQFQASLHEYPARFNGLYGAARAAAAADRPAEATQYFEQLLAQTQGGDGTRPELAEARAYLAR